MRTLIGSEREAEELATVLLYSFSSYAYIQEVFFDARGVATCWPLETMQVCIAGPFHV